MLMKLFLVEDATIYMILLQKLLENDFQITLSKNIADAKKIIEDEDYQFDVMLIDLMKNLLLKKKFLGLYVKEL